MPTVGVLDICVDLCHYPELMDDFYERLGKRIRSLRTENGATQEDMAGRLGVNRTTFVNIEKGRQRLAVHQLVDLANALGCDPGDLLVENVGLTGEPRDEFVARVRARASQPRSRP